MQFPRNVVTGTGVLENMESRKCTVICDPGLRHIGERIADKTGGSLVLHDSLEASDIKKLKTESVLGVGGGRTLDIAKYAAFCNKKEMTSIPTTLSNDGIASKISILKENGKKTTKECGVPIEVIADFSVIKRSPYRLIAAGFGDAISNISAVADWTLADKAGKDKYNRFIGDVSLLAAKSAAAHAGEIRKKNEEGIEALLWSLLTSGFAMNFHSSSRPCSGSEHAFSHALDASLGGRAALHGEQVAMGTIISLYLHDQDWEAVRKLIKDIGLPINSKEIGISDDELVKALVAARDIRKRYTILDKAKLGDTEAREVLKNIEII